MNIYVKETTIFSVFHPDAHDLFNTCSDLKKVAYELWDPTRRLKEEAGTVLSSPLRTTLINEDRTKVSNSSAHLHQCSVNVRVRSLTIQLKIWKGVHL